MTRFLAAALALTGALAAQDQASAIHAAARAGDLNKVRALVEQNTSLIQARDEVGRTPLHLTAGAGSLEVVSYLIARGADPDAADNNRWTPLHMAASADQAAVIGLLVERGAALDSRTAEGETALALAASRGRTRAALRLLEAGAAVDAANSYGRTPLLLVARESGKAEIARALLDRKASIGATDKFGDTALSLSAWRGFREVVDLLLERGAPLPAAGPPATRLAEASASAGLTNLFTKLAGAGASLSGRTDRGGTMLHLAAGGGSAEIVAELLARKFGVNDADSDGWTPLHNAAFMGRLEVVKALVAAGADLRARTVLGQTAWNLATEHKLTDVAQWLATNGSGQDAPRFAVPNGPYLGQTPPGRTPVEFAVGIVGGHFDVHSIVTFSPDGREAYWSESIPPRGAGYSSGRTMISRRVGDRWTYPERAMLGSVPLEDVPVITADGTRIFDMAKRRLPGQNGSGKENIWVADRTGDRWGEPRPLDQAVNALPHHWQFSVARDGSLYFASTWKGSRGLFVSRPEGGVYTEPVLLGPPVSVSGSEAMPFLAADGSYLLFQRNYDIFVSFRGASGIWADPVPLPASVNTREMELCPTMSPDGRYLFFMRDGHVYWVDAAVISELKPAGNR